MNKQVRKIELPALKTVQHSDIHVQKKKKHKSDVLCFEIKHVIGSGQLLIKKKLHTKLTKIGLILYISIYGTLFWNAKKTGISKNFGLNEFSVMATTMKKEKYFDINPGVFCNINRNQTCVI